MTHRDLRRARSAGQSIIPTTTKAARAVAKVLPKMQGRLNGFALLVLTPTVSVLGLVYEVEDSASIAEINTALEEAAAGPTKGILGYEDRPLVSVDFRGNDRSSVVDALSTMTEGNLAEVVCWYDNEWGYSNRLVDLTRYIGIK